MQPVGAAQKPMCGSFRKFPTGGFGRKLRPAQEKLMGKGAGLFCDHIILVVVSFGLAM
jgi:hypothetical protein